MIKLRQFIKYKGLLILGTFSKLIEVVLELFVPIFMGILVDEGVNKLNINITYKMVILIFSFALLGYLCTVFAHFLTAKVSQNYAHELRLALFNKVIDFKVEDKLNFSSSTLINRLNSDVLQTSNALAMTMRIGSRAPFLMLGSIIALYIQTNNIATVFLIILPVVITLIIVIVFLLLKHNQLLQKETDNLSLIVKENIEGIQSIKAFVKTDYEVNRFNNQNIVIQKIQKVLLKVQSFGQPSVSIILNLGLVFMLYLVSKSINNGYMLQGQAIAMISYTTSLIISVIALFNLILLYARAITANARIRAVLSVKTDKEDIEIMNEEIKQLSFDNVSYHYPDQKNFLNNITFEMNKNEIVGVIGLTGSGKTTLLKMINRSLVNKTGNINVNNFNINNLSNYELNRHVAFVTQKSYILKGTIKSNIQMGINYTDEQLLDALALSCLPADMDFLNKEVSKNGQNLSGGQRQRLNIARAIIKKTDIIILDDLFASLDNQTQKQIKENLKNITHQPLIIIAASTIQSIDFVDKLMVLNDGAIEVFDTLENVKKSSIIYQKLNNSQDSLREVL